MDRGGKLRSDWNRCLLEDVVAPTFTLLLSEVSKQFGPITLYNSLWPCGSFAEPWLSMVKRFYISASELPLLHTAAVVGSSGGRWLTPKEALYHDEEFVNKEELARVLIAKGFPLVRPSMTLRNMLFMYCVLNPRMVLPHLIRSELRKPGKHVGLVDRSNALVLLEYCLGDVIDEEAVEVLSGLPLIPLANGALGVFERKGDRKGLSVICNELEFQLVRSLPGVIVDMGIPKELFERLTNIARVGNASLCCFSYVLLAQQFLNQILPPEWKGVDEVEWKPDLVSRHPNEDWLMLCWQYLRENCKTLSSFEEWPLLPTTTGHLCRLRTNSKVLRSSGVWSSSIEGTIVKLGCLILRNGLGVEEHQQLSAYVHSASAAGVLDTIFVAASHQLTRVPLLFAKVSNTERRELRKFLSDGRWYAGNQLSDIQLHVLKSLPIFEVYSGAPGSSDDDGDDKTLFVDLLGAKVNLAPLGMDKSLLGPEFLHSSTQWETQWLAGPLGVVHL
jgi:sacsin